MEQYINPKQYLTVCMAVQFWAKCSWLTTVCGNWKTREYHIFKHVFSAKAFKVNLLKHQSFKVTDCNKWWRSRNKCTGRVYEW